MKLWKFLFATAFMLTLIIVVVFATFTKNTVTAGLQEVRNLKLEYVAGFVRSAFEAKRTQLIQLNSSLRNDNDLASAYVLAVETKDYSLVSTRLEKLLTESKLGYADILTKSGKSLLKTADISVPYNGSLNGELSDVNFEVVNHGTNIMVYSVAPLNLYGKMVGYLALGSNLISNTNDSIGRTFNVGITYRLQSRSQKSLDGRKELLSGALKTINLYASKQGQILLASIRLVNDNSGAFLKSSMGGLLLLGILCLIAVISLFLLVLQIGFLRGFKSIISDIRYYIFGISCGNLENIEASEFRISENQELSDSFVELAATIRSYSDRIKEKSSQAAFINIASQVAHDIRSPLSALNLVSSSLVGIEEGKRLLIRTATQRINDIANNLLQRSNNVGSLAEEDSKRKVKSDQVMLSALIDSVISEKRAEFINQKDLEIRTVLDESYGLFAFVNPSELSRAISNIINNAVEALSRKGHITATVYQEGRYNHIMIADNGPGVPAHLIARLGERGFTYGKRKESSGTGLGLYHARLVVEGVGGKLTISSDQGHGTTVKISLPKIDTPAWFVKELIVMHGESVISVDDDNAIHQIWNDRFRDVEVKCFSFATTEEFKVWHTRAGPSNAVYLVDYEFMNGNENGLDLIEALGIVNNSILVTSRFEDHDIRQRAEKLGVRLIPKTMAALVPILIDSQRKCEI